MEEGKKDPSVSQLVKAKVFIARGSGGDGQISVIHKVDASLSVNEQTYEDSSKPCSSNHFLNILT